METQNKERERILCVDDEPSILEGLKLHLGRRYDVATASSGAAGLEDLERNGSTAVVLSDMRMPGMDGATFLSRARETKPDTVRILLTGQADLNACIAAINQGQIFRFLVKPCPPDMMLENVKAAVAQYRLITAERVLLEETLRGSIKTLIDVLSLANPLAFGRASRIKRSATELIASLNIDASWQVEVAAMMSQVGCVSLPAETIEKLYYGKALRSDEKDMADKLPALAEQLLANIPRLEEVRAILVNQNKHFDGTGVPANGLAGETIPLGSRILKIAIDYDRLEAQGLSAPVALDTMRSHTGWYDPKLLETFSTLRGGEAQTTSSTHRGGEAQTTLRTVRGLLIELPLKMVEVGMTFAEDLRSEGTLLVARGQEVTKSLVERIRNLPPQVAGQRIRIITKVPPPKT